MTLLLEDGQRAQQRSLELQLDSATKQEAARKVQGELDTTSESNTALAADLKEKSARLASAEKLVAKISVEKLKTKALLTTAQTELEALRGEKKGWAAGAAKTILTEGELEKATGTKEELEATVVGLRAEVATLTEQLASANAKVSSAEKLISKTAAEKFKLKAELKDLKGE